ncbi:MAG: tripartite tricarboxylate transporter TctB family protein [Defluviitaleaceae bacterium]|nr:tripartite tricarboxylate transporter TctB family protein [Defluviitaleaceae bacterium]
MKIKYRTNLWAGILSLAFGAIVYFIIPAQIGLETRAVHGVTSRSIPYALSAVMALAGIGLLVQSLVLKIDEVKELELDKEAKGVFYMLVLLVYGIMFPQLGFILSACILGVVTLAFRKCKKILYYGITIVMVFGVYYVFSHLLNVRLP